MKDENWPRMIVVTAAHGEKFLGWIPKSKGDPKDYVDNQVALRMPIELEEVRCLVGQVQTHGSSMAVIMALMCIDMFPGPLGKHHVVPSSWYFPNDMEGCKRQIADLLKIARNTERDNAAIASGIQPVRMGLDKLPPPPGGKH